MPLPDPLPIVPFTRPVRGEAALPGSKSITNRAMLLAALCDGPVTLQGALFSEDTRIMAEALRRLGFSVREDAPAGSIRVVGQGGKIPAEAADLFVGNAGTAARFLTALCAAAPRGVFKLDGVPAMRKRPMKGLIDALRSLGTKISCLGEEGFFPLEMHAQGLRGGLVKIDPSESSQMLSALLLVAPLCRELLEIDVIGTPRWPFVKMTMFFTASFGGLGTGQMADNGHLLAPHGRYRSPHTYRIESDASAASYFFALPLAAGGTLHFSSLSIERHMLQGDIAFAHVLEAAGITLRERKEPVPEGANKGLRFIIENQRLGVDVAYHRPSPRPGITQDFKDFSDTFLTLAAVAPLLDGPTTITGIAHTRKQETDRVGGMARELTRLGQMVEETEDSLVIHPRPLRPDQTIETYDDHRFAMSFAILGCHDLRGDGRPWLSIKDPACCAKTFPNFFEVLESLRLGSLQP